MEEYNKVEEYTKKELINKWISYLLTNGVVITIIVILFRSRHSHPQIYHIIGSFFILMELFLISIMFFGSKIQYYFQKNLLEIQMKKLKK